jgi:hypothetical protein
MARIAWIFAYWPVFAWAVAILIVCGIVRFYFGQRLATAAIGAGTAFII